MKHTHGGFLYNCKRCLTKFSFMTFLKEHITINHRYSRKVVICPKCEKRFKHKSKLKTHIRVKHENTSFYYHTCDAQFSRKYVLNNYIEEYHGLGYKYFDCNDCPEKFLTNNLLKRHTKRHHPEGYFIFCSQSPKKVSLKQK